MLNFKPLWRFNSSSLSIESNMLDLWRVNLIQPAWKLLDFHQTLSEDEKERANRFLFSKHRKKYVICRGYLRYILSRYLDVSPSSIKFSYSQYGKPLLSNNTINELKFNLSHSENLAIYAITYKRMVGVDVEFINPEREIDSLVKSLFSKSDMTLISKLSREKKIRVFYKGWTIKEAYLKATGEGLAGEDKMSLSVCPDNSIKLLNIEETDELFSRWSTCQILAQHGYIASLVVEGQECLVTAAYDV